jgi:hypothetical protein
MVMCKRIIPINLNKTFIGLVQGQIFFLVLAIYFLCTWVMPLSFFNKISITYEKKCRTITKNVHNMWVAKMIMSSWVDGKS